MARRRTPACAAPQEEKEEMKNVTDSLKASESTAVIPVAQPDFFAQDEFTISVNDFYTGQWSRHDGAKYLEALNQLKIEARKRGYDVSERMSMDTMINYVTFTKRRL